MRYLIFQMDQQLLTYIKDNLKKGYSKESIVKKLEESGLDDATINLYFNEVNKKKFPVKKFIILISLGLIILVIFLAFNLISFDTPPKADIIPKNNNSFFNNLSQNVNMSSENDETVRNILSVLPSNPSSEEIPEDLTNAIKTLDETFNKECIEKECIPFEAHLYVTAYNHLGYDIPNSTKEKLKLMVDDWIKYYKINYNKNDPYLTDPKYQIAYVLSLEDYFGHPKDNLFYEWESILEEINMSADGRLMIISLFENSTISNDSKSKLFNNLCSNPPIDQENPCEITKTIDLYKICRKEINESERNKIILFWNESKNKIPPQLREGKECIKSIRVMDSFSQDNIK
jgi:hypothetical protein